MAQVPAATRTLQVLKFLASQPEPVALDRIAKAVGMPRSTAYHLINAMIDEGFVVHLVDDSRYGLGVSAFEVGQGFSRQAPLQRLARRLLASLVDDLGQSAHLAVMHGRDVLYVLEERAPGRPPLVTDVGVRLPAHLTASGRAMLASLPAAQVRALFPDKDAFVQRYGDGPSSLSALRSMLVATRAEGFAREEGSVTPGFSSVAVPVLDHNALPIAAVAVTYPSDAESGVRRIADAVARTAKLLGRRLSGH